MGQNGFGQGFTLKRIVELSAMLALGGALLTTFSPGACRADDDWEAVSTNTPAQSPPAPADQAETQSGEEDEAAPAAPKTFTVCGERATAPAPRVKAMVDRINDLWGSNYPVYQTVELEQPHASPGGCIFYNPKAMEAILTHRLIVNDQAIADPLVWAIFAHEMGHQVHRDTEKSREWVPSQIKELEADRFSGYTLEKLQIPSVDLTPFWNMTGDEFGGAVNGSNQHGLSSQRVAAFKQGWHLAEWNRAENSQSVADAEEESTAPDTSSAAPK
jgi:hypothetical protein